MIYPDITMQPGCISLLHEFMQLGCNRISITLRQKQLKHT